MSKFLFQTAFETPGGRTARPQPPAISPERLDEALRGDRLVVVNHGVPGYTTAEHLLQTAFYPEKFAKAASCAVFRCTPFAMCLSPSGP